MKRRILFAALALAMALFASQATAAKARFLSSDGDGAHHDRHLSMHVGEQVCRSSANYLKVRRRAGGSVVGHVEQADLLTLLGMEDGWARIRVDYSAETSPDSWPGLTGYVDADYLECGCGERAYYGGYTEGISGGEILSGGVNLRELPSKSSRSLAKLSRG